MSAIGHVHRIQGWESPTSQPTGLLRLVLEGAERTRHEDGLGSVGRQGITARMLIALLARRDLSDFKQARFAAYASLSLFGGFRANELVHAASGDRFQWNNLEFDPFDE